MLLACGMEMATSHPTMGFHLLLGMSLNSREKCEKKCFSPLTLASFRLFPHFPRLHQQCYNVPFRFEFLLPISVLLPRSPSYDREIIDFPFTSFLFQYFLPSFLFGFIHRNVCQFERRCWAQQGKKERTNMYCYDKIFKQQKNGPFYHSSRAWE